VVSARLKEEWAVGTMRARSSHPENEPRADSARGKTGQGFHPHRQQRKNCPTRNTFQDIVSEYFGPPDRRFALINNQNSGKGETARK